MIDKKICYLSRKLKAFTFEELYVLAETPKEELKQILQTMVKENILKETSQGYVYCEFDYFPQPTEPKVKAESVKFVRDDDYIKFKTKAVIPDFTPTTNLSNEELEKIPEYNLRTYNKYMYLLKITNGLSGSRLKEFIKEYNLQNPTEPTSYQSVIRKRKAYVKFGDAALISKYGKVRKPYYTDMPKYYKIFKEYYLKPYYYTIEQCRQKVAQKLRMPIQKLPSGMSFRRCLYKEMSLEEIHELRSKLCF